jgi:hypothetical protein
MATRRPPAPDGAIVEGVRSLYAAAAAVIAVGAVATALALAARVAAGHSLASAVGTVLDAAGHPVSAGASAGTGAGAGEPAALGLGVLALAAGCWLLGAALVVDGVRDP